MKVYHCQIQTATGAPAHDLPALELIMRDLSSGTLGHLSEKKFVKLAKNARRVFAESEDLFSVRQLHSKVFFELKSAEQELTSIPLQAATAQAAELKTELQDLANKESELRAKLLSLAA
jgi:hypothetical protein